MMRILLAVGVLTLLLTGIGHGGDGYTSVTAPELKSMMDRKEPDLVVIDTRSAEEYREAHIRGAVNIPWSGMEKEPALLAYPKQSKIVFYCNGFS